MIIQQKVTVEILRFGTSTHGGTVGIVRQNSRDLFICETRL